MLQPELLALSPVQGPGGRLFGQAFRHRCRDLLTVLSRVRSYSGWTGGASVTLNYLPLEFLNVGMSITSASAERRVARATLGARAIVSGRSSTAFADRMAES